MYCEKADVVFNNQEKYKALWKEGDYGKRQDEKDIAFLLALPAILPIEKYKTINVNQGVGITPDGLYRLVDHIDVYWDLDRALAMLKDFTLNAVRLIKERRDWSHIGGVKDIYDY